MPLTAAQLSVKVTADTSGAEAGLRNVGRAASEAGGGMMPSTGYAIVGENGPEIVKLPGSTQVYSSPSQVTGSMRPIGPGASGTQNINLVVDGRVLARVTAQHLPNVVAYGTGTRGVS